MRRFSVFVFSLSALVAGCSGDAAAPTAPTPAQPTFQLLGLITDASAGIALQGVTVSVSDGVNQGKSSVTGADGRYSVPGLLRDSFVLRTQIKGYADHLQDVRLTQTTNLDIRLTPKRSLDSGWTSGQLYFAVDGVRAGNRITRPSVAESGATVSGTFSTAEGGSGTFTGTASGTSFTGTIRTDVAFGSPQRICRGSGAATGHVSPDYIAITATTLSFENCASRATAVELSLQP